ncbi:CxxC-x17-CxxC domain-containing protein, partial [Patescibacteria group bacterium]
GGGRGFGGDRGGRKFGGDRPEMHKVVCSKCGDNCEVPFKPTTDKPLFCSKCFGEKSGGDSRGRDRFNDRKPRFGGDRKPSFGGNSGKDYKAEFEALNAKMDKILRLLKGAGKEAKTDFADPIGDREVIKAKKKEINKKSLKESLAKAISEESAPKKKSTKKKATKKVAKKKTAVKKKITKKATKKKTAAKKTTKKVAKKATKKAVKKTKKK